MTDQEVYELLIRIDVGYSPSEEEKRKLSSIESIKWTKITQLPKSMSMLSGLVKFVLMDSGVGDITAISGLTGLTNLDLSYNLVLRDISALSGMTGLTNLDLGHTNVSDISVISGMKGLINLDLSHTRVSDISVISGMTGLTNLDLSQVRICV